MCKDGVGSRCGNRLAYRRFWRRARCVWNIIVAREEGDSKRLHNYNFDAPSMCGGLSTCGRLGFGSVARQTGKAAEVAEKLGKLCGEKCLGGGNNVEIVPFGCFAKTQIERIVVADPQGRGGGEKDGGARRCRAICGAQDEGGAGNVNKIWWMVVFDIVGSVSAREGWVGKNGESMRQTE